MDTESRRVYFGSLCNCPIGFLLQIDQSANCIVYLIPFLFRQPRLSPSENLA